MRRVTARYSPRPRVVGAFCVVGRHKKPATAGGLENKLGLLPVTGFTQRLDLLLDAVDGEGHGDGRLVERGDAHDDLVVVE